MEPPGDDFGQLLQQYYSGKITEDQVVNRIVTRYPDAHFKLFQIIQQVADVQQQRPFLTKCIRALRWLTGQARPDAFDKLEKATRGALQPTTGTEEGPLRQLPDQQNLQPLFLRYLSYSDILHYAEALGKRGDRKKLQWLTSTPELRSILIGALLKEPSDAALDAFFQKALEILPKDKVFQVRVDKRCNLANVFRFMRAMPNCPIEFSGLDKKTIITFIKEINKNCPERRFLVFKDLRDEIFDGEENAQEFIQSIGQFPGLDELDLSQTGIEDAGFQLIMQRCPNVRHLVLVNCDELTSGAITAPPYRADMVEIHISDGQLTDAGLQTLCQKCPELKILILSNLGNLTNDGIINANLPRSLKVLDLSNTNVRDCQALNRKCPDLTFLNLSDCDQAAESELSDITWAKSLKIVLLEGTQLTDTGLQTLAVRCPKLEVLDLNMCTKLSAEAMRSISWPRGLKVLLLSGTEIDDAGLERIFQMCLNVQCVETTGCPNITIQQTKAVPQGPIAHSSFYAPEEPLYKKYAVELEVD